MNVMWHGKLLFSGNNRWMCSICFLRHPLKERSSTVASVRARARGRAGGEEPRLQKCRRPKKAAGGWSQVWRWGHQVSYIRPICNASVLRVSWMRAEKRIARGSSQYKRQAHHLHLSISLRSVAVVCVGSECECSQHNHKLIIAIAIG
eukprot:scaffold19468_cov129-Isochrysis_galbana.AAC.2